MPCDLITDGGMRNKPIQQNHKAFQSTNSSNLATRNIFVYKRAISLKVPL